MAIHELLKDNIISSNTNKPVCCRVCMKVKCDENTCGYEWDYEPVKIKNPLYATCPRCNSKIRLREGQG